MTFMLPELIAMSSMMNSFAMSSEINIARFYWKTFDEIRSAARVGPGIRLRRVLSGMLRGGVAAGVVIVLGMLFHVPIHLSPALAGAVALTTFIFASLAILHGNADEVPCGSSNAVELCHHTDGLSLRHFLSGGSLSRQWIGTLVSLLPLTPAAKVIRAAAQGNPMPATALAYLCVSAAICFSLQQLL